MFNPVGSDGYNEFVELYNQSSTDSIDLANWLISDGDRYNLIVPIDNKSILLPGHYAIVLSPRYFEQSGIYDPIIPPDCLVLSISHTKLGKHGFANSRSETVGIYKPDTSLTDSRTYNVPIKDGYSEEKELVHFDNSRWGTSMRLGGTPGFQNSIHPPKNNLKIDKISLQPSSPTRMDSIGISFWIVNLGVNSIDSVILELGQIVSVDSSFDFRAILLDSLILNTLDYNDSLSISVQLPPLSIGLQHLGIRITYNSNIYETTFNLPIRRVKHSVIINELYLKPENKRAQWIELYNNSDKSINLKGWQLNWPDKENALVFQNDTSLLPDEYIVITSDWLPDSSWLMTSPLIEVGARIPSLDPVSDIVVLISEHGTCIDSVFYNTSNIDPVTSIERDISDLSWHLCKHPHASTPGEINSISVNYHDLTFDDFKTSTSSSNITIEFTVTNIGKHSTDRFSVELYNLSSHPTGYKKILDSYTHSFVLLPQQSLQNSFSLDSHSGSLDLMLKIIDGEETYPNNNCIFFSIDIPYTSRCLVVNEIMYNTDSKNEEWIELFNTTHEKINLKNWFLRDKSKQIVLTDTTFSIDPFEYLVIAHDKCVQTNHLLIQPNLPSLNNGQDEIVLIDPYDTRIDSVYYDNSYGGDRNKSLERIRYDRPSIDPTNWGSSIDSSFSTPGYLNSLSPKQYDIAIFEHDINYTPKNYHSGENINFDIHIQNAGRQPLTDITVNTYYRAKYTSETFFIDHRHVNSIAPFECEQIKLTWETISSGIFHFVVELDVKKDQNRSNNSAEKVIHIGYPRYSIVINEIMPNPAGNMSEWFELYNRSSEVIQLKDWKFSTHDTSRTYCITDTCQFLRPNNFIVIAKDSIDPFDVVVSKNFPALSKNDSLFIYDSNKNIIDFTHYKTDKRGIAIERINPDILDHDSRNWGHSVHENGHTLGKQNSLFTQIPPPDLAMNIAPNPFSPDGDGFDDIAAIQLSLPTMTACINIKIYDMNGRLVNFLCNNEGTGASKTIFWDGHDYNGQRCRMGIYIIYLEALDVSKKRILELKETVVLATKL